MVLTTMLLGLSLYAAPSPDTYVVVSRRSGVLRGQAFDLAVAVRQALIDERVPSSGLADDATECGAKASCLLARARSKRASVLVTVDVGSVLEDVVVHLEALSVDEDGRRIVSVDVESSMKGAVDATRRQVANQVAPAIRAHLGLTAPTPVAAPVVAPPPPSPPPTPPPMVVTLQPEPVPAQATELVAPAASTAPFFTGRRIAGVGVAGAGVVALAVGAVMFSSAASASAQVAALCPAGQQCNSPEAFERYRSAAGAQNTALVLTGVGGVAALTGALLLLWPGASSAASETTAVLVPTRDGATFAVSGSF
jgi:hypothetical protein